MVERRLLKRVKLPVRAAKYSTAIGKGLLGKIFGGAVTVPQVFRLDSLMSDSSTGSCLVSVRADDLAVG